MIEGDDRGAADGSVRLYWASCQFLSLSKPHRLREYGVLIELFTFLSFNAVDNLRISWLIVKISIS